MKIPARRIPIRVPGFSFAGVKAGIKPSGRRDIALIVSDVPAVAAAAFTRNKVVAAPVIVARDHARARRARAILVSSGNANACTGARGVATVRAACSEAARVLGLNAREILPCATGKIGVQVPRGRLVAGVRGACAALSPRGFWQAVEGISTTDAFLKGDSRQLDIGGQQVTVAAMAKGAGMISPDMATLLVFVCTDARISGGPLRQSLLTALQGSFNAITVDGDMSTNDTTIVLANGGAGNASLRGGSRDHRRFTHVLEEVLGGLGRLVVLDGEGATKCVEVLVRGGRTAPDARRVARAIGTSTLTRAAFHGGDPNWGRILCAAGYAGAALTPERCRVWIGSVPVARSGQGCGNERAAARVMRDREFRVTVDLGLGSGTARIWTSDLSPAYVRFNAEYST
jgi:glutamate N-acetyltransferase/amino-acid N-acetyltransferase